MAKTIKFNLILDGASVRDLDGLRENFSIEDMLKYFYNGLLLRWLSVRGYEKQFAAVKAIKSSNEKAIVTELVKIFEVVNLNAADIEKAVSILAYLEEEKELNTIYAKENFAKRQIIGDYHSGYLALVEHMEENEDNMAVLKADAIQMEKEYLGLFELDNSKLFYRLLANTPKSIFAILTRDALKKFWIGQDDNVDQNIYSSIKRELLTPGNAVRILGKDAKFADKNTQGMWDYLESSKVKVMVIYVWNGTFVKNEGGDPKEKISPDDVNGKLTKLNGLEYQCNNDGTFYLYDNNNYRVCDSCGGNLDRYGNCEECGRREPVSYKVLYMEV